MEILVQNLLNIPLYGKILLALLILLITPPIRRPILSVPIMLFLKKTGLLPTISETEQAAIDAGSVWIDGDLFSGKPNFKKILKESYPKLKKAEADFINNQVETLCNMTTDWEITQKRDFPEEVWEYLKKEKFFGMIIPKKYGGLEFSALAHSTIIAKIASRSTALAITTMVPNSLGPAELLVHYGTEAQKDHYLPRLADGREVPCFALTEPDAGSDAGAMTSHGEVFEKNGKHFIRLTWEKRYITLAAISTVLGVAFKLSDPKNLLGKGKAPGITCALVPSDHPGVILGKRHDPLGIPFFNCPTEANKIEIPVEWIIGGKDKAGLGWRMLMESLAAGRGISLPANCTGGAKLLYRAAGAYAGIRHQFGLPIGKFEGIEEPLARIGGYTYLLDAMRTFIAGAIDGGAKPAVITAIAKYNATETFRTIINDGMDILGGAAISRGPKNLLANPYIATPISITVEGANIITRTLIIFGQGAIRCHPYALAEIEAVAENNTKKFDRAFWGHISHIIKNTLRSKILYFSRGNLSASPIGGPAKKYIKKLNWSSATFAILADLAMGLLGGELKRKESITGRFGDILSWMFLATTAIRRFEADGRPKEDEVFLDWSCQQALYKIQTALEDLTRNMGFPFRLMHFWFRLNPIGKKPSDKLSHQIAKAMQSNSKQRQRLTEGLLIPKDPKDQLNILDAALIAQEKAAPILKALKTAIKKGQVKKSPQDQLIKEALSQKLITPTQADTLKTATALRNKAVEVDAYDLKTYTKNR